MPTRRRHTTREPEPPAEAAAAVELPPVQEYVVELIVRAASPEDAIVRLGGPPSATDGIVIRRCELRATYVSDPPEPEPEAPA